MGAFLTNPNPTVAGTMSYTGLVVLAPNTTYWMVVDIVDASLVAYTNTNTVTSNPSTGGADIPGGSARRPRGGAHPAGMEPCPAGAPDGPYRVRLRRRFGKD